MHKIYLVKYFLDIQWIELLYNKLNNTSSFKVYS